MKFSGAKNITMVVPRHQYEAPVRFCRDTLRLTRIGVPDGNSVGFEFDSDNLGIDRVPAMSQAELWLEIITDNTAVVAASLAQTAVESCGVIEPLGEKFDGYWISSPAPIMHLVDAERGCWT